MGAESSFPSENSQPNKLEQETFQPLFLLGQVVATPGALETMHEAEQSPHELLYRHMTGDWGDLPEEDKAENHFALQGWRRIFSSYRLNTGAKIWLITEADRSATTFLLPEEY